MQHMETPCIETNWVKPNRPQHVVQRKRRIGKVRGVVAKHLKLDEKEGMAQKHDTLYSIGVNGAATRILEVLDDDSLEWAVEVECKQVVEAEVAKALAARRR